MNPNLCTIGGLIPYAFVAEDISPQVRFGTDVIVAEWISILHNERVIVRLPLLFTYLLRLTSSLC